LIRKFDRPGREGPDITHAFIYVGDAHADNLSKFFDRIMTLDYKQIVKPEEQCVHIPHRDNMFN